MNKLPATRSRAAALNAELVVGPRTGLLSIWPGLRLLPLDDLSGERLSLLLDGRVPVGPGGEHVGLGRDEVLILDRTAPPSSRSRPDEAHTGREQPDEPGGEP
jgi:hypothetical protein